MLPKNLEAFILPIIAMAELQFPRSCPSCGRAFENFGQFVQLTTPIGSPIDMRVKITDPMEIFSWTNCACGSTLVLMCDPGGDMHAQFEHVLNEEARADGRSADQLLLAMRKEVRRRMGGGD